MSELHLNIKLKNKLTIFLKKSVSILSKYEKLYMQEQPS